MLVPNRAHLLLFSWVSSFRLTCHFHLYNIWRILIHYNLSWCWYTICDGTATSWLTYLIISRFIIILDPTCIVLGSYFRGINSEFSFSFSYLNSQCIFPKNKHDELRSVKFPLSILWVHDNVIKCSIKNRHAFFLVIFVWA